MPRVIDRPVPGAVSPATSEARREINSKLANDGVVDAGEARDLVRGWRARPLNATAQREIKDAFQATRARFQPQALATVNRFVSSLRLADPPGDVVNTTPNNVAKLTWDPPTTNTDGTPLNDLAGYKIYYGPSPGNYTKVKTVNDRAANSASVENLPAGTWYFAVKAFDTAGTLSGFSNEASKTVQ